MSLQEHIALHAEAKKELGPDHFDLVAESHTPHHRASTPLDISMYREMRPLAGPRIFHTLRRLGCGTLEDAASITPSQLLGCKNFGITSLQRLQVFLGKRGVHLKGEPIVTTVEEWKASRKPPVGKLTLQRELLDRAVSVIRDLQWSHNDGCGGLECPTCYAFRDQHEFRPNPEKPAWLENRSPVEDKDFLDDLEYRDYLLNVKYADIRVKVKPKHDEDCTIGKLLSEYEALTS